MTLQAQQRLTSLVSTPKTYTQDQGEAKRQRLAIAAEKSRLARASLSQSGRASTRTDLPIPSLPPPSMLIGPSGKSQSSLTKEQRDKMLKSRLACLNADATKARSAAAALKMTEQSCMRKARLMPIPKQLKECQEPWVDKSADEIMNNIAPLKSAHEYDLAWAKFEAFRNNAEEPHEADYLKYFDYLHDGKKFKASTLWKNYGMLNNVHQRKYGTRLQIWPRLKMLLKGYNQG